MMHELVVCCFCGASLPEPDSVVIVLYPTKERDESQELRAHGKCIVQRLVPGMPFHPSLEDHP